MEYARVGFVIDYQNIHLTAHNLFTSNQPKQDSLLHPLKLAESVLSRRRHFFKNQVIEYEIAQVRVETAGWTGLNKLRLTEQKLFHTFLTREDFENSIDQKDYSKKG